MKNKTAFNVVLTEALKKYHEPQWLGANSPLAMPYFLGKAMENVGTAKTSQVCGEVLKKLLWNAACVLWGNNIPQSKEDILLAIEEEREKRHKEDRYFFLLLELRYFNHFIHPNLLVMIWEDYLYISKARYFELLKEATKKLGQILLQQLQPSLRLEQPPQHTNFVGREKLFNQCLAALEAKRTITISGPSGVGKTTLAAAIADKWPNNAVFWFTFRPVFQEQLNSLLFALGCFFHQQGDSRLWQQLVADGGKVSDVNHILGLVKQSLDELDTLPLLCFDEINLLHPSGVDLTQESHTQILEFLDSLRSYVPIMFVGEQPVLKSDCFYAVSNLSLTDIEELLTINKVFLSEQDIKDLYAYTGGMPHWVELCIALLQESKHNLTEILQDLPKRPSVTPLFYRLWRYLSIHEKRILQFISVFRSPVPADSWQAEHSFLNKLIKHNLIKVDKQGGVSQIPILQTIIYQELSAELKEIFHLKAAQIRDARGEYTAAAYHYQQSDNPEKAIAVWYPNRKLEINRGLADSALFIFRQVSRRRLNKRKQKELSLLRSELYALMGETEKGETELDTIDWSKKSELTLAMLELKGDFLERRGETELAMEKYKDGLELAYSMIEKYCVHFRIKRSFTQLRQGALKEAWSEARLARYEVENLYGVVQDTLGNYVSAREHYLVALALADTIKYEAGTAQTHRNLAMLAGRHAKVEEAETHSEKAMNYYQHIGDLPKVEHIRCNLAATYIQANMFEKAIECAKQAYDFFVNIKHSYWIANSACNLAEAYLGLDYLEKAVLYARLVLEQDEPESIPYAFHILGNVEYKQADYKKAKKYYKKAKKVAELNQDKYIQAYIWRDLGKMYLAQNKKAKAKKCFNKASRLFEELGLEDEMD